jgi:hypothetical protein
MAATFTDLLSSKGLTYGIGDIHAGLYAAPSGGFRDIVTGTNGKYPAVGGYDLATGFGVPQWGALQPVLIDSLQLTVPAYSRSRTIPVSVTAPSGTSFSSYRVGTGVGTCQNGTVTPPSQVTVTTDGRFRIYADALTPGGACVMRSAETVVDTVSPTASVTAPATPFTMSATVPVTWTGSDAVSGIDSYEVGYQRTSYKGVADAWIYPASWQHTKATGATSPSLSAGYNYCLSVRASDKAGNVGAWSAGRCVTRALDDRALAASANWIRGFHAGYYMNTYTSSVKLGSNLNLASAELDRIAIIATKCSTCGMISVYVGTTLIAKINLHAATTERAQVIALAPFSLRSGTVDVKTLTAGKTIQIDGLAVLQT